MHGLTRALGGERYSPAFRPGFTRELDVVGTGFRVDVKGKSCDRLRLATRTLSSTCLPTGIDMKVDKQTHVDPERL